MTVNLALLAARFDRACDVIEHQLVIDLPAVMAATTRALDDLTRAVTTNQQRTRR